MNSHLSAAWSLSLFALAVFGFAFILGASKISLPFRMALEPDELARRRSPALSVARDWLLMLIECPACLSFHLGWLGWLFLPFLRSCLPLVGWQGALMLALTTCATSFILASWTGFPHDRE